jgi:hypothetical protein
MIFPGETPMAEILKLNPHDPMPDKGHNVIVLRRFDEDDPHKSVIEITLTHARGLPERSHPARPDGSQMSLEEAVAAASKVADEAGIKTVHVIDRLAGPRERDIQQHGGDHTVHMERLDDDDMEEGEPGPDMRRT